MGVMIGPTIKPIRHLQIDHMLLHKDQTLWALSSDLKLKGCLHLFATLNGTLQKLIWISVSYCEGDTEMRPLIHEDALRLGRAEQM